MGGNERQGAGNLIALAALEAHQTILNQVETAKAVVARNLVEGDDDLGEFHLLAVDATGLPTSNSISVYVGVSGVSSGFLVITQASSSGSFQGSSRWPHSMARPHRLSSME